MNLIKSTCPLDCWDQCAFLVREVSGKVVSIGPNPAQPVTGGNICSKGKKHLERLHHPDRLRFPLLKKAGSFKEVSWTAALQIMAEKILDAIDKHGPLSLLHFYDGGSSGLLKNFESRFFSALGGCTTHRGSLCWGAGIAAQKYDFGLSIGHPHDDLVNSNLILIWGRNPANTSIHLLPFIRQARKNGARLILIDPIKSATAELADEYIRIKPGSDGALALGMAGVMIAKNLFDKKFVKENCSGFDQYSALCAGYSPDRVEKITGISAKTIEKLGVQYAEASPAAIMIGIGLQRHSNGGSAIRAIDALAALSGNIGKPGGGATYANFRTTRYIDHDYIKGNDLKPQNRLFPKPQLAAALAGLQDPPVKFLYISRANPLVQVGDSGALKKAFQSVSFKVTVEHFMTDTAAASDLVLPATCFLEESDLYFNSMGHQYLTYGPPVVQRWGESRPEYVFLKELADILKVAGFPDPEPDRLLTRALKPLTEATGITLEQIKDSAPLLLPGGDMIPWSDGKFETADGKYNFYSRAAEKAGGDSLPVYREPFELGNRSLREEGYIYWFATPHARDSIHSIHRLPGETASPVAYISSQTALKEGLTEGDKVRIVSKRGFIEAEVQVSKRVPNECVMVYQGWWHSSGAAVNMLTPDRLTDLGNQAAYYDCLCRIERLDG